MRPVAALCPVGPAALLDPQGISTLLVMRLDWMPAMVTEGSAVSVSD
jgi:hypothetical protein